MQNPAADWRTELVRLREAGTPHVLVTVVRVKGSTPREVGARMIVVPESADARPIGTIGGGHLELQAITEAFEMARGQAGRPPEVVTYPLCEKSGQCCGGSIDLLYEAFGHEPELVVFGAGHVGQAVARVMAGTPFTVHLVDERKEWITSNDIPDSTRRHAEHPSSYIERVGRGPKHIIFEVYRNEQEKINFCNWQLTSHAFYTPKEWEWLFQQAGYTGDYSYIWFE
jgi:xanthine dehydrogenase accessory factor